MEGGGYVASVVQAGRRDDQAAWLFVGEVEELIYAGGGVGDAGGLKMTLNGVPDSSGNGVWREREMPW